MISLAKHNLMALWLGKFIFAGLALGLLSACSPLAWSIKSDLYANPNQDGIRWGLAVSDLSGRRLISLKADDRFTPASNAKIATSMAGFKWLDQLEVQERAPGLRVFSEDQSGADTLNLVLVGGGDAQIGDGSDCEAYCLAELADQIVAAGVDEVGDIIGDDQLFPDERWGPGWSQEDLKHSYGTAVSALSVNDNQLWLTVSSGDELGQPARLSWRDGDDLYTLVNETITVAADQPRQIVWERLPGASTVRVFGEMPINGASRTFRLGVDDPALFAAKRLKRLLIEQGVQVNGDVLVRHRPLQLSDYPDDTVQDDPVEAPLPPPALRYDGRPIAQLPANSLAESLDRISRQSQNLHAEILLRRLGLIRGSGSRAHGLELVDDLWEAAGVTDTGYAAYDGSGMSIYHRMSPAGMVKLLIYASREPWFEDWKATLPVGGVDGTLARSFKDTSLEGKIFAKTGTLNGVNALSGYMVANSGRELVFSIVANDRPSLTRSAVAERNAALLAIAEAY